MRTANLSPHSLLEPLTDEQQALVVAVFEVYRGRKVWPNVHYLDRRLGGRSIAQIVATLPTLGSVGYRVVSIPSTCVHDPKQEVALTVAGLAHVEGGETMIAPFLRFLRCVAARLDALPLSPTEITRLDLRLGDLVECLGHHPASAPRSEVEAVVQLIPREPSTWRGPSYTGNLESWTWADVPQFINRFADVMDVPAYLERLAEIIGPPPPAAPTLYSFPLGGTGVLAAPAPRSWLDLVHPALREDVRRHAALGQWTAAVRESAVHLEEELRSRSGIASSLVGVDLVTAALKPGTGPIALPRTGSLAEQTGWHLLVRGFMQAVRNPVAHRRQKTDEAVACAAIGIASLVLFALDESYPPPDAEN